MNKFLDYGFDDIKCDVKLPAPIIEEFDGIQVVRDDLLNGGFKFTNPQANRTCGCGTSFSV